jgi:hypothetical protein
MTLSEVCLVVVNMEAYNASREASRLERQVVIPETVGEIFRIGVVELKQNACLKDKDDIELMFPDKVFVLQ